MSVNGIAWTTRKARKYHRCAECRRDIAPGETYHSDTFELDGSAYTWKSHQDCRAMSGDVHKQSYWGDYPDGYPPLREDETVLEQLDDWRGKYPHVVCRLEFGK